MILVQLFVACFILSSLVVAQHVNIQGVENGKLSNADGIVFINDDYNPINGLIRDNALANEILGILQNIANKISKLGEQPAIHLVPTLFTTKLVFAATGPLNSDIADSRTVYDTATKALEVAYKAGIKRPLLVVGPMNSGGDTGAFTEKFRTLNAVLGALYALYVPLQNVAAGKPTKYEKLIFVGSAATINSVESYAKAIEEGRWIARDLCGADPEFMTPKLFSEYVHKITWSGAVTWQKDVPIKTSSYPLIKIFDRSNNLYPDYQGMIMKADYTSGTPTKSLYMIGQGVTFDTGGYDLRIDGSITGMSRQKCGAAGIVGFLKTMEILNVPIKITTKLVVMRNDIGAAAVVSDEIVKTMNNNRLRIGFTQALGRMMLSELLFEAKDEALKDEVADKHIYTVATMSAHVIRCYKYIMGVMDNGPAAISQTAERLQAVGDLVADLGEISVIRQEDYDATRGPLETEDMLGSTPSISETMKRGHQIPMAFMVKASGLINHGLSASPNEQLKYTHLDVTGSAGRLGVVPTGSPIPMLTQMYSPIQ